MKTIKKDRFPDEKLFGPDPLLYKKKGLGSSFPKNISDYKQKIEDDDYMSHAIDRISVELMHFLVR